MSRPFAMRIRPLWLRQRLAYGFYLECAAEYEELFTGAPLEFAPAMVMDLLPSDAAHRIIALTGFYELVLTRRIVALARFGGCLVDVGANYGYYTCMWAGLNPGNHVLAIEASPRNIDPLRRNVRMNNLDARVTILEVAAGKEEGFLPFDLANEGQSGWGGLSATRNESTVMVRCRRLDDLVEEAGLKSINVLKVDVEGADSWVLLGAERLLREKRILHIFFEENVARLIGLGIRPGDAARWLNGFGYQVARVGGEEWYATAAG